jgi:hypothetical protein
LYRKGATVKGISYLCWFLGVYAVVALCGCSSSERPISLSATQKVTESPAEKLHEQLRSGAFQFNLAVDALVNALDKATKLADAAKGAERTTWDQVQQLLNRAGEQVGDFSTPPPDTAAVAKAMDQFMHRRDLESAAASSVNDLLTKALALTTPLEAKETHSQQVKDLDTDIVAADDAINGATQSLTGN